MEEHVLELLLQDQPAGLLDHVQESVEHDEPFNARLQELFIEVQHAIFGAYLHFEIAEVLEEFLVERDF